MSDTLTNDLLMAAHDSLSKANATIAALEKRIGELEAAWDQLTKRHAEALTDLAAERQRREDCQAALRDVLDPMGVLQRQARAAGTTINGMAAIDIANKPHFIQQPARDYFSLSPSESDNPPKVWFRVGEDHSYYGGPDYKCVTAEQCSELEKRFAEAERDIADNPPKVAG